MGCTASLEASDAPHHGHGHGHGTPHNISSTVVASVPSNYSAPPNESQITQPQHDATHKQQKIEPSPSTSNDINVKQFALPKSSSSSATVLQNYRVEIAPVDVAPLQLQGGKQFPQDNQQKSKDKDKDKERATPQKPPLPLDKQSSSPDKLHEKSVSKHSDLRKASYYKDRSESPKPPHSSTPTPQSLPPQSSSHQHLTVLSSLTREKSLDRERDSDIRRHSLHLQYIDPLTVGGEELAAKSLNSLLMQHTLSKHRIVDIDMTPAPPTAIIRNEDDSLNVVGGHSRRSTWNPQPTDANMRNASLNRAVTSGFPPAQAFNPPPGSYLSTLVSSERPQSSSMNRRVQERGAISALRSYSPSADDGVPSNPTSPSHRQQERLAQSNQANPASPSLRSKISQPSPAGAQLNSNPITLPAAALAYGNTLNALDSPHRLAINSRRANSINYESNNTGSESPHPRSGSPGSSRPNSSRAANPLGPLGPSNMRPNTYRGSGLRGSERAANDTQKDRAIRLSGVGAGSPTSSTPLLVPSIPILSRDPSILRSEQKQRGLQLNPRRSTEDIQLPPSSVRTSSDSTVDPPQHQRTASYSFQLDSSSPRRSGSMAGRRGRKTALVVDNNTMTQRVTSVALYRAGYTCDIATDGESAIRMAAAQHYDLIITDIILPNLNGLETTSVIRSMEDSRGDLPSIIMCLTSAVDTIALEQYAQCRMNACIERGAVLSEAVPDALEALAINPSFLYIDAKGQKTQPQRIDIEQEKRNGANVSPFQNELISSAAAQSIPVSAHADRDSLRQPSVQQRNRFSNSMTLPAPAGRQISLNRASISINRPQ